MKKKLLLIAFICFIINLRSQNHSEYDKISNYYSNLINEQIKMRDVEIKNLPLKNYVQNKETIVLKYNKIINNLENIRDSKLLDLRGKIQKAEKAQQELIEENRIQKEKEEEEAKIKKEKEEEEILRLEKIKEEQANKERELKEEKERLEKIELDRIESEKKAIELEKKEQELEELKAIAAKRERFERSDKGQILKELKRKLNAWNLKGELETESDFKNRIETKTIEFFNKTKVEQVSISKRNLIKSSIASACLKSYDAESEKYLIGVNPNEYRNKNDTFSNYIKSPILIAPYMKDKYGCRVMPENGSPILVHILELKLINDNWIASKIIFMFPNKPYNGNDRGYYDAGYSRYTIIEPKGSNYILSYKSNINIESVKLTNIANELGGEKLDKGNFYYEWNLKTELIEDKLDDLNINSLTE